MNNEEPREKRQQRQQQEDHDLLRSERKARGALRNAHLEAGREQARSVKALTGNRKPTEPPPTHDTSDDDYEAERKAQKEADQATMKAEARSRYEGSDAAFERDWPKIREQLVMENLEEELKHMRRRL